MYISTTKIPRKIYTLQESLEVKKNRFSGRYTLSKTLDYRKKNCLPKTKKNARVFLRFVEIPFYHFILSSSIFNR